MKLTIDATRATIASGEPVDFTLTLTNGRDAPLWTNPSFVCSGSWDLVLTNASGERQRIDDRDSMGCPSGGPLTTQVAPGGTLTARYSWDGERHPRLGAHEPMPPGDYTATGSARWADRANATGDAGSLASAQVRVTVTG